MNITPGSLQFQSPPARERGSSRYKQATAVPTEEAQDKSASSFSFKALALAALPLLGACTPQPPAPVHAPNECALVVIDSFVGSSHGETVTSTALKLGPINQVDKFDQSAEYGSPELLPFRQLTREFGHQMGHQKLSPQQSSELLDTFFEDVHVESMGVITRRLETVNQTDYKNSAANLSLGLSELSLVDLAEKNLDSASYRENLTQALHLSSGASKAEIKQALLDRAASVMESSGRVEKATQAWRDEVKDFESDNNSVVVSAGNSGGDLRDLKKQGYRVSDNADRNFLDVPEATVVGASQSFLGQKSVSGYSRQGEGVDIHARGRTGLSFGTSFSSPSVSAALRAVHCDNPTFSSDQAESYVKDNFGEEFGQGLTDLSLKAVSNYIRSEGV